MLLLVACGTGGESATDTSTTTGGDHDRYAERTTQSSLALSLPEGASAATVENIIADAAQRAGVPTSEVAVSSLEGKTFNVAALGCPEPGKISALMITPGFIVLLDEDGDELDHRVPDDGGDFRICEGLR